MFSNLRVGTPLYVLQKQDPKVSIGEVQSVGAPVPQFGTTYNAGYIQPPKMYVDVRIKVGDETIDLQKLPADETIADFGTNGMVVSENREAILTEIDILERTFQSGVDNYDKCLAGLDKCHEMREQLNPTAKQDAQQRHDIDALKAQMANIEGLLSKLLDTKKED